MPRLSKQVLPLIPVRGLVIFPNMVLHFDVARKKSVASLERAMVGERLIFLSAQRDITVNDPEEKDICKIGVVAKIKQLLKLPNDSVRVLVEGLYRGEIRKVPANDEYFEAEIVRRKSAGKTLSSESLDAIIRHLQELLDSYMEANPKMAPETLINIMDDTEPGRLADALASNLLMRSEDKQTILEILDVEERLVELIKILTREIKVLEIENKILTRVKGQMDKNSREYFLREQVKAIQSELGEDDSSRSDYEEYSKRAQEANLPGEVMKKVRKELARLLKMPSNMAESAVIRSYLDLLIELPWSVSDPENTDLQKARDILQSRHFGMDKVKERIIEYLAVRSLSNEMKGSILCLAGPPGVGKTSIAKAIAEAAGRRYVRMSLGGVKDEAEIRGHRRTYVGAMPGRIISAIRAAGAKNALVLLDEIDKMSHDFHGDPASAMLEVLDSEQNFAFRDHYLELPFDLSEIMFITTANHAEDIPRPLLDRMEIITLSGYTEDEKLEIATHHLLPKQLKKHGLKPANLKIGPEALKSLSEYYTREAGVRELERQIATVCRKAATLIVAEGRKSVSITPKSLPKYLGVPKYRRGQGVSSEEIGIVNGLAWTSAGGEMLSIEVNVMDGSGKIELTGSLGDVMKESARAAITYIRSRAIELHVNPDFYKNKDIHIHVPEGSTPKDGPSAGITIATALVSALTGRRVRRRIAMTGEITIRGRVLAIGGLKEKSLAAYRSGIKQVFIPEENIPDLEEVSLKVRSSIRFTPVSSCDGVLSAALLDPPPAVGASVLSEPRSEEVFREYS